MRLPFLTRGYYNQEGGTGGGSGPVENPVSGPPPVTSEQIQQGILNLIQKHNNDPQQAIGQLYGENDRQRDQIRQLKDQVQHLTAQVPAEGSTILSAEEAALVAKYQELGDVATITQRMQERDEFETENTRMKRDLTMRDVCHATGYKRSVLEQIGGDWDYTIKEEDRDGGTQAIVYVTDHDGHAVELSTYLAQHYADFLPALQPDAGKPKLPQNGTPRPGGTNHQQTTTAGTPKRLPQVRI